MSREANPLIDMIEAGIERRNEEIQRSRIDSVKDFFQTMTGIEARDAKIKNDIVSLGENTCLFDNKHKKQYSLLFCIISTPRSPCEENWAFGTSTATPRSLSTAEFMEAIPSLPMFERDYYTLKKYAEIIHCHRCSKPIIGEFGYFVSSKHLDTIGAHGANIRIFAVEQYELHCQECQHVIDHYFKNL